MPRRNRPTRSASDRVEPPAPRSVSSERREFWHGVPYTVRTVPVARAVKTYRCPGCDQEIRAMPHIVSWPENDLDAGERRHWHTVCWSARDRRTPTGR